MRSRGPPPSAAPPTRRPRAIAARRSPLRRRQDRVAHELIARALQILREAQQHRAAVQARAVLLREQRPQRARVGQALAVIARRLRHDRDLRRGETRQAAVEDQVARVLVVVVVVDRHPDVVQHARRPQQLALARLARVQPHARELVEHTQRQRRDVARVRDVHVVARREVQHRGPAHVLEQRRLPLAVGPPLHRCSPRR